MCFCCHLQFGKKTCLGVMDSSKELVDVSEYSHHRFIADKMVNELHVFIAFIQSVLHCLTFTHSYNNSGINYARQQPARQDDPRARWSPGITPATF